MDYNSLLSFEKRLSTIGTVKLSKQTLWKREAKLKRVG